MRGRRTKLLRPPGAGVAVSAQLREIGRPRLGRVRRCVRGARAGLRRPRRDGRVLRCARWRAALASACTPPRVRAAARGRPRVRREPGHAPRERRLVRLACFDVPHGAPPAVHAATWRLAGAGRRFELARRRRRAQPVVRQPRATHVGSATMPLCAALRGARERGRPRGLRRRWPSRLCFRAASPGPRLRLPRAFAAQFRASMFCINSPCNGFRTRAPYSLPRSRPRGTCEACVGIGMRLVPRRR